MDGLLIMETGTINPTDMAQNNAWIWLIEHIRKLRILHHDLHQSATDHVWHDNDRDPHVAAATHRSVRVPRIPQFGFRGNVPMKYNMDRWECV